MTKAEWIKRLKKAREFIKGGWLQGRFSADKNGRWVHESHPRAVAFCLSGALTRAGILPSSYKFVLPKSSPYMSPTGWNDHAERKKSEVLDCITNSIKALEAN